MYWIILILFIVYLIIQKLNKHNNFFHKNGIKYEKSWYPLGNSGIKNVKDQTRIGMQREYYETFSNEKIFGFANYNETLVIIRDTNLIKKVTIKDFNHFTDRSHLLTPNHEPLVSSMLTVLVGQKWHDMRLTLSPTFTTSKMKYMYELVLRCTNQLDEYLLNKIGKTDEIRIFDMENLFSLYYVDAVASCAFGVEVNSLNHPNNRFCLAVKEVMSSDKRINWKILIMVFFPKLFKFLNLNIFTSDTSNFFRSTIVKTMDQRNKENIIRPDMINVLLKARNDESKQNNESDDKQKYENNDLVSTALKRKWTDDELVAQCMFFLGSGNETTSNTFAFTTNELALNPDVQEKLFIEIIETEKELNGKPITYEKLLAMKYIHMVLTEVLRKWPTDEFLRRTCTKDYVLQDDDDNNSFKFNIKRGTAIGIPILGLHYDPNYFPNPDKFDPERFNDENIKKVNPLSYIPFGIGPRNCIASRFAFLLLKSVLYNLVKEFKIEICSKTCLPLKSGRTIIYPDGGIHLGLRKR